MSTSPERSAAVTSLRDAAAPLVRDLEALFGAPWHLRVDEDLVMTVATGERSESVRLGEPLSEVDRPECDGPLEDGGLPSAEDQPAVLGEVALEYLAAELSEVLSLWGYDHPNCPMHDRPLGACGREWFCDGPPAHSVTIGGIADLAVGS